MQYSDGRNGDSEPYNCNLTSMPPQRVHVVAPNRFTWAVTPVNGQTLMVSRQSGKQKGLLWPPSYISPVCGASPSPPIQTTFGTFGQPASPSTTSTVQSSCRLVTRFWWVLIILVLPKAGPAFLHIAPSTLHQHTISKLHFISLWDTFCIGIKLKYYTWTFAKTHCLKIEA